MACVRRVCDDMDAQTLLSLRGTHRHEMKKMLRTHRLKRNPERSGKPWDLDLSSSLEELDRAKLLNNLVGLTDVDSK